MPRPRRGALTDAQTLSAYEAGTSPHALAEREGCTAGAILARISRERRIRRDAMRRRERASLPQRPAAEIVLHPALAGLREAVRDLERQEAEHA